MPSYRSCHRRSLYVLLTLIWLLIDSGRGNCDRMVEIAHWVAAQMQIRQSYSLPTIHLVEKLELNSIFLSGSEQVMARWVTDHGLDEANKLMNVYLDSVVGLFDPKSNTVYVGAFLSPCRQKAILAHEIVHYFQYVVHGPVKGDSMAGEMLLMEREIEACTLERMYEERFCEEPDLAQADVIGEALIYFP